jgi:hypothetical protein
MTASTSFDTKARRVASGFVVKQYEVLEQYEAETHLQITTL